MSEQVHTLLIQSTNTEIFFSTFFFWSLISSWKALLYIFINSQSLLNANHSYTLFAWRRDILLKHYLFAHFLHWSDEFSFSFICFVVIILIVLCLLLFFHYFIFPYSFSLYLLIYIKFYSYFLYLFRFLLLTSLLFSFPIKDLWFFFLCCFLWDFIL